MPLVLSDWDNAYIQKKEEKKKRKQLKGFDVIRFLNPFPYTDINEELLGNTLTYLLMLLCSIFFYSIFHKND